MMRKLGALDGAMENFGPFHDAMGKLETLDKAMWKLCGGRLNDLMEKLGKWALDGAMEHLGPFGEAMGKLETLAMGKFGPLMT